MSITNNAINIPYLDTPGNLLIGTGTRPVVAPLVAGTGIVITTGPGLIKIDSTSASSTPAFGVIYSTTVQIFQNNTGSWTLMEFQNPGAFSGSILVSTPNQITINKTGAYQIGVLAPVSKESSAEVSIFLGLYANGTLIFGQGFTRSGNAVPVDGIAPFTINSAGISRITAPTILQAYFKSSSSGGSGGTSAFFSSDLSRRQLFVFEI